MTIRHGEEGKARFKKEELNSHTRLNEHKTWKRLNDANKLYLVKF